MDHSIILAKKRARKRQKPTHVANHYPSAGYFTRINGEGTLWKFPCREFKHALYWMRYYGKHHPEENISVAPTSYRFVENELLSGGRWIDETDGNDMGGFFYGPPGEIIEYSPTFLAMSKHTEHLNVNAEYQMNMVRWFSLDRKAYTGRMWISLPNSIMASGECLEKLCREHVTKWYRYEQKKEFEGKIILEKQRRT